MNIRFAARARQHLYFKSHCAQQIRHALGAFVDIQPLHQLGILRRDANRAASRVAVMTMVRLSAELVIVLDIQRPVTVERNQRRGTDGDGIDALRRRMTELAAPTDTAVDVVIPYDRGDLVARLHAGGRVQQEEHNADGTRIRARVPEALVPLMRRWSLVPSRIAALRKSCKPQPGPYGSNSKSKMIAREPENLFSAPKVLVARRSA